MIAPRTRRWLLTGLTTIAIAAAVLVAPIVEVYTDCAYVCECTGSRKGCRSWFLGVETGAWYKESALETFIKQRFPSELEHRWTNYAGTGKNIFDSALVRAHGHPGPISQLPIDLLADYSGGASPAEMKHLYDTMRRGGDSERKAMIHQVWETVSQRKGKTEQDGAANGSQPFSSH